MKIRGAIDKNKAIILGFPIWIVFFVIWELASFSGAVSNLLLPPPHKVLATGFDLLIYREFGEDILISVLRVVTSFLLACAIAVPLGVLMGTYPAIRSVLNPFISAWRYLPAPAFVPILLMWFGTGEAPKVALLVLGVVFFLATLVMDHTANVRMPLIETAMTLGAAQSTIVRTVIVPAVLPNIVDTMRQMLAISWTYLVVAEIVASTTGIGAMMMRARRFLATDEILAGIVVIGCLGLLFDMSFRLLHRRAFSYLYQAKG